MRFTIVFALAALALGAQTKPTEKFTVEKIEPEKVAAINKAEVAFDKAIAVLAEAQKMVDAAENKLAEATTAVTRSYNAFEGGCVWSTSLTGIGSRNYRRIQIRGDYLLISNGTERCDTLTEYTTTLVGHPDAVAR